MKQPLGEIAEIIRGVTFSASEGSATPSSDRLPVIRAGSIQDSLLLEHDPIWILKEKIRDQQKIQKDDIIMCMSSGSSNLVGKCARSTENFDGSFGAFCAGIRPDTNKVSASYLYYFLSSPLFKNWSTGAAGANIKNIRASELAQFEIPLPPLEEQKHIAAILDKADAIRRKRQQAIQLTDDFLRSVFLDMFGSSSNNLTWKKINFGEVTEINAPMIDPQEKEYSGLIHIGPDRIEKNNGRLLPSLTAKEENLISKKFLFDQSYVLYSKIRPYLRKAAIPNFIGICSADMYPIKPIEGLITREYLWQLLLSDEFTKYTETLPNRASIPKLNRKELANFSFKLPPLELQKKFSTITKQTLKNNLQNDDALEVNNLLFESLAQKAFRGEL